MSKPNAISAPNLIHRALALISPLKAAVRGNGFTKLAFKLLFVTAVFISDPFHAVSGAARVSEDTANRVLAYVYPSSQNPTPSKLVRDDILVVLLSDADAEYANPAGGYPVPLQTHGEVLRTILCAEPAAVFVDMNFRWERQEGDAAALADAVSHRRRGAECVKVASASTEARNAPVLVAYVPSHTSDCEPMAPASVSKCDHREAFATLRSVVRVAAMPGTDDTRRYILHDREASAAVPGSSSPSLDLYRHVCRRFPGFAPGCADVASVERLAAEPTARLAMRWGFYTAPAAPGAEASASACPERQLQTPSATAAILTAIGQLARDVVPFPAFGARKPELGEAGWCPYHNTIGYRTLSQLAARDPARLSSYVKDKVVIYGADITAVNDNVVSPVLGLLPAAHQHAMALDNLLTFGSHYWRDPAEFLGINLASWVSYVLTLFALLVGWRIDIAQRGKLAGTAFFMALTYLTLAALAAVGFSYFLSSVLSWAPINWTGVFGILVATNLDLLIVGDK